MPTSGNNASLTNDDDDHQQQEEQQPPRQNSYFGCHLKVVLFCSGNGADVKSYRPRRDESQWWNRRDALVRCVTAFLFGPQQIMSGRDNIGAEQQPELSRELVLFYDGDHCCVHMALTNNNNDETLPQNGGKPKFKRKIAHNNENENIIIPTEQVIIALWKEAIGKALANNSSSSSSQQLTPNVVRKCRLACWVTLSSAKRLSSLLLPEVGSDKGGASKTQHHKPQVMIQDWSKRQLLEYLQKECSMEFLREHGLNSAPNVILRKANRSALAQVFQTWNQQQQPQLHSRQEKKKKTTTEHGGGGSKDSQEQQECKLLEKVFQELLSTSTSSNKTRCETLIAATLHESSDCELPCFGDITSQIAEERKQQSQPLHLCLFLGAVRDMIPIEYQALENVCNKTNRDHKIPLVKVRLGSVPEFTSKILSVVAFHHSHGRLGPAMRQLVLDNRKQEAAITAAPQQHPQQQQQQQQQEQQSPSLGRTEPPQLHTICLVPLSSDQIVTDLEQRNRALWCLVRVLVTALWRSRLASSGSDNSTPLDNTVTLVFQDGSHTSLKQKEWVSSLAEQHQAAPSEYQVLHALKKHLETNQTTANAGSSSKSQPANTNWSHRAPQIVNSILAMLNFPAALKASTMHVVSLEQDASPDLVARFYTNSATQSTAAKVNRNLFVILPIVSRTRIHEKSHGADSIDPQVETMQKAFLTAFDKANNPQWHVHRQSLVASSFTQPSPNINNSIECEDWEALSITMLQHFLYQDRMFLTPVAGSSGDGVTDTNSAPTMATTSTGSTGDRKRKETKQKEKHKKKKGKK